MLDTFLVIFAFPIFVLPLLFLAGAVDRRILFTMTVSFFASAFLYTLTENAFLCSIVLIISIVLLLLVHELLMCLFADNTSTARVLLLSNKGNTGGFVYDGKRAMHISQSFDFQAVKGDIIPVRLDCFE